jgi:hypothetical protein
MQEAFNIAAHTFNLTAIGLASTNFVWMSA